MNKQQALELLELDAEASQADIIATAATKQAEVTGKKASAPTEALAIKFNTLLERLQQAEAVLTAVDNQEPGLATLKANGHSNSYSPLSHTKLADLPGMTPQDSNQLELQPGQLLASRYEIKELIGQGGMGAVYRAFDKNRDEDIAIKVLLPSLTQNERALERFLNEARVSSKLSHPNIVNVYDVQQDGGLYFLTMELLEGQDLRQIMDNQKTVGRPFDVEDVKEYIAGVSEGLAYAHQHTVHRDIKPENIWVTDDQQIKLMDFGIAQLQSTSQRTQTGAAMGTAYYMAPEQLKGVKEIDGRADQYALAVLAYEMLTEEVPAGVIEPVNALRKDIPKGMAAAIMQAMNARPENRFADITAFNAAIQSGKGAKKAKRSTAATAHMNTLSNSPSKWGVAAAVLLLVGGVGGAYQLDWLDALKPLDKELIAQQKAEAAGLQGEIKTLKRRFDNAVRDLDSDIRDAERNKNSKEIAHLQAWLELAKRYLVDSSRYGEMEGLESQANLHLRDDKQSAQALTVLMQARDGYQNLIDDFYAAEKVLDLSPKVDASRKQWQEESASKAWPVSVTMEELYQAARQSQADGLMQETAEKLLELQSGYPALVLAAIRMRSVDIMLSPRHKALPRLVIMQGVTEPAWIATLKQEEQQHRQAFKTAATVDDVLKAVKKLEGVEEAFREQMELFNKLEKALWAASIAKATYEKNRKGYSLDTNATAQQAGEQYEAAKAALKSHQWMAADKGFADATAGYEDARKSETTIIAGIGQARVAKNKALAAKADFDTVKQYDPDSKLAVHAEQLLASGLKALDKQRWHQAIGSFVEANEGFVQAKLQAEERFWTDGVGFNMITIPAGSFRMGSTAGEDEERPVHTVNLPSFYMQEHEVTWNQYQPCIDAGVCSKQSDAGWGKDNRPVIRISWNDVQSYIGWLNNKTGMHFRLPSEAEWEYAARAGSTGEYNWGDSVGSGRANCDGCGGQLEKGKTVPVKSFSPNAWGLYDMHGNVWEWVQDCWHDSYRGAPANGSAWTSGGDCSKRVLRGGSWLNIQTELFSANRSKKPAGASLNNIGFRLVRDR